MEFIVQIQYILTYDDNELERYGRKPLPSNKQLKAES
jgi:hypothetical protein